jgi:MFS family permease
LAQICSGLGDWIFNIALLLYISNLKLSGVVISILLVARVLPFVIIGPISGNYIDSNNRQKIMIIADLIRMMLISLMAVFIYMNKNGMLSNVVVLSLIYILSMLASLASTFFNPSRGAIIPNIVEKDNIRGANSLMSMSNSITLVLGPIIGGMLVSFLGIYLVSIVNAISFLFSAILISFIKSYENIKQNKTNGNIIRKYIESWQQINEDKLIKYYSYTSAIRAMVVGTMNVAFVFVARNIFDGKDISLGILYCTLGVGIISGSFVIGKVTFELNEQKLYLGVILTNAFFSIIYVLSNYSIMTLTALFLIGFSDGILFVLFDTFIHKNVPNENIGKVYAANSSITMGIQLLSMSIAGLAFDIVGYRTVIFIISIITAFLCIVIFCNTTKKNKKSYI